MNTLPPIFLTALAVLVGINFADAGREEIIALKKRYIAVDSPLAASQQRAMDKLAQTYFRMLTGIDTPAAKREAERFRTTRREPREPSPDPKVAEAQERLAHALEAFEQHPRRRARLAAEYLRRLELAGEPAAAVLSERGRLEETLGRDIRRGGDLDEEPWGDTFVRSGEFAEQRFGGAGVLGVSGPDEKSGAFTDDHRIAYLRFDLSGLPEAISDARLMLRTVEHEGRRATHTLSASSQRQPWDEDTSTYNGHPSAIHQLAKWQAPLKPRAAVYIDLTDAIRERREQGISDLDVRIHCAAGTAYVGYGSRENADESLRPRLLVNHPGIALAGGGGDGLPKVEIVLPDRPATSSGARTAADDTDGRDRHGRDRGRGRAVRDDRDPDPAHPQTPVIRRSPPIVTGAPDEHLPLNATRAQVNSLLASSAPASEATAPGRSITATAVESPAETPMDFAFDQPINESMRTTLAAVARALQAKYKAWPRGHAARLSFDAQPSPQDARSTAVACALLIEGLITGSDYDPGFAVTGALDLDLSVRPVRQIEAKLRSAKTAGLKVVAIPACNASTLDDMVVLGELAALAEVQVFRIESFDQARDLALAERPLRLQIAIDKFDALRAAGLANMRSESGLATLREIVELAPQHASAAQILRAAEGNAPQTLSLPGSFRTIDAATAALVATIRAGRAKSLSDGQYGAALHDLQGMKNKIHPRAAKLHTKLVDLLIFVRRQIDKTFGNAAQYRAALAEADVLLKRVESEHARLAADPEVAETLAR